jgi:hypothetical protein
MMTAGAPAPSERHAVQLPWFCAWTAVGVGLGLGVSALGVFAVPLALLATVLLLVRHHAGRAALGVLVGIGLVSLCVAYVQPKGPGTVTWHTATASGSESYLDPRPWLVAGILLVVVGAAGFLWLRRVSGGEEAKPEP